jgi:hypothetical protein
MVSNTFPNSLGHVPNKMIDLFLRYLITSLLCVLNVDPSYPTHVLWDLNPKNELANEEFRSLLFAERS